MRKINVIKGDMIFQWKYGFYLLYFLMIIIYMMLFSFFEGNTKNVIVDICVYSDPAAMGMFFMGALILLEKSQRITNSIAISPVSTREYILAKVISIGIISEVVGVILISQGKGRADTLIQKITGEDKIKFIQADASFLGKSFQCKLLHTLFGKFPTFLTEIGIF